MLRCVLHRRIISSISYGSTHRINACGLINCGTQQALWSELREKSVSLPGRLCMNVICSSIRAQDLRNNLAETEISESKKTNVKRKTKEREREQQVTVGESGQETRKKKTRKKKPKTKELSSHLQSDRTSEQSSNGIEALPSLSFPFDGSSYSEVDDEFSINHHGSPELSCQGGSSVVHIMDNCSSEGRFYQVSSEGVSVLFPSVTTVLSNTVSKSQHYRLRSWRRGMIKEHGEAEFESIQQQTRDTGTHFHQVSVPIYCIAGTI